MKSEFLFNIKRTWKYAKGAKKQLILYGIVSATEAVMGAIIPLFSAKVILGITDGIIEQLIYTALFLFGIKILRMSASLFKVYFYRKVFSKTQIGIQESLTNEILNLEISEIDKNSSGLFIDRLTKDPNDLSQIFMEYTHRFTYIISNIGVLVSIFILNKYLFVFCVMTSVVSFIVQKIRLSKQYKIQKELRNINENKTGLISELVRGIRDIKVMNASKNILDKTYNNINLSIKKEASLIKTRSIYNFFNSFIDSLSTFLFIVLGCLLLKNELLTIPTFLIIYNYMGKVESLLKGVVELLEYNKKFTLAASRVYEIIDSENFKKEKFGNKVIKKLDGSIIFDKVEFGYDKTKVLKGISFEIKPNERVAFVGKSGEGKTTIFNLIAKFYETQKGSILLDGYNIKDLSCSTIRDNMSIITQSPYIFNFTIKENLLLAKNNASMKEIREACKLACIDDFIMSLPKKYNTKVGENGVILSGGQKQRLAIARALLMKTEMMLFDEATSALDNETQSEIQQAINNLKGEYTILIVAHRLSTVIDCDRIFVIDDGRVVNSGTHKYLLKNCEIYKNLYEKDLNT